MQDLYKGFKKVAEDEGSARLQHENGHELSIAKSGLSKKHKAALEKLPLYQANGTENQDEQQPSEIDKLKNWSSQQSQELQDVGREIKQEIAQDIVAGATEQKPPTFTEQLELAHPSQPAPHPGLSSHRNVLSQQQPLQTQSALAPQTLDPNAVELTTADQQTLAPEQTNLLKQGEQQDKLRELAEKQPEEIPPASQLPQPTAPTKPPKYASLMDLAADPNQPESIRVEALIQEQIRLQKEYEIQMADFRNLMMNKPESARATVFSKRDTWGKIGVVVGLLLGGMSSGITGKGNPAMELLNKEIEDEANRQKNSTEQQMNLFKMNLQMLGDQRQALLNTQNQIREMAQLKADEILGKTGSSPQTRMAGQALYAENRAKMAKANAERAQLQISQAMKQKYQAGVIGEIPDVNDPWIERAVRIQNPDGTMVKRYVKDKSMMQEASREFSQVRELRDLINTINNFNKIHGMTTGIPLIGSKDENEQAKSLNEQAQAKITELMSGKMGAVRPGLLEKFKQIMPIAGAATWNQSEQQARAIQASEMMTRLTESLADQYLVQPSK